MYSKEEVLRAIDDFVSKNERIPKYYEYGKENNLPAVVVVNRLFGSPKLLYIERYPLLYEKERNAFKEKRRQAYKKVRGATDEEFKTKLIQMLDLFIERHDRVPKFQEFTVSNGLASKNTLKKYLGDIKTFLKNRYPQYYVETWNKERIRRSVEIFRIRHQRLPLLAEFKEENNLPKLSQFRKCCTNVRETLHNWYPEFEISNKKYSKESIYALIDAFVEKHNRLPYASEYKKSNGFPQYSIVVKYCGTVEAIYEERYKNKVAPNTRRWNEEKIIRVLDEFVSKNKRIPSAAELISNKELPSISHMKKHISDVFSFLKNRYPEYDVSQLELSQGWTLEMIVSGLRLFKETNGRFPKANELKRKNNLPSYSFIRKEYGGLSDFKRTYFPEEYSEKRIAKKSRRWNKEKVLTAIDEFIAVNNRLPKSMEFCSDNNLPSATWMSGHIEGSITTFLKQNYPQYCKVTEKTKRRDNWDRETVILSIEKFINVNDRLPLLREFNKTNGLPSLSVGEKYLGCYVKKWLEKTYPELYEIMPKSRKKWDKEKVLKSIDMFVINTGRLPKPSEFKKENGLPVISVFKNCCGTSLKEFYKRNYPQYSIESERMHWTKEKAENCIEEFVKREGRLPLSSEFRKENNLPSHSIFRNVMQMSRTDFYKEKYSHLMYTLKKSIPDWDKDKILEAVRGFISKNGRFPNQKEFTKTYNLPSVTTVNEYFDSINSLREEYFNDVKFNGVWTEKEILDALLKFKEEYNRFPKIVEWRNRYGLPCYSAVSKNQEFIEKVKQEYFQESCNNKIKWHKEKIIEVLDVFVKSEKRLPSYKDFYKARVNGLPSAEVLQKNLGDWRRMLQERYPEYEFTDDKLKFSTIEEGRNAMITAIDEFVKENSRPPKNNELVQVTNISRVTISKYLGMPIAEYCKENYPQYYKVKEETQLADELEEGICMMM